MNFQWEPLQTNTEILQERLKKKTSFNSFTLAPLWILGIFCISNIAPAMWKNQFSFDVFQDAVISSALFLCSVWQLFLGFCLLIWRSSRPEQNLKAAKFCFYFNLFIFPLAIVWSIATAVLIQNALVLFANLFISLLLVLEITKINRLIKALLRPQTPSAKEQSSPCPEMFRLWHTQKSFFWAPFLLIIFGLSLGAIGCLIAGDPITKRGFLICLIISSVCSIPVALIFWPISLAAYFTKQTGTPSAFQRFIRHFAIIYVNRYIPPSEITAFRWWLSHPNQEWPPDAQYIFKRIDTDAFDWQDINKWSI